MNLQGITPAYSLAAVNAAWLNDTLGTAFPDISGCSQGTKACCGSGIIPCAQATPGDVGNTRSINASGQYVYTCPTGFQTDPTNTCCCAPVAVPPPPPTGQCGCTCPPEWTDGGGIPGTATGSTAWCQHPTDGQWFWKTPTPCVGGVVTALATCVPPAPCLPWQVGDQNIPGGCLTNPCPVPGDFRNTDPPYGCAQNPCCR